MSLKVYHLSIALFCILFVLVFPTDAQRNVSPFLSHERILAVVPMIGQGTAEDPFRPMFVPKPPVFGQLISERETRNDLAFTFIPSDDGKSAIVEIVTRDRSLLAPILADRTTGVKVFERGKASREEMLQEFRKIRKDFDFNRMGVTLP